MTDEEMVKAFEHSIYAQLRTLGAELYDDAGNRMKPGSGEERRIITNIARNIAQLVVSERERQTPEVGSCECKRNEIIGQPHLPSCPEYPAYLKDA